MPKIDEQCGKPRRILNIFYVLDTSGSMKGEAIGMLNSAMEETVGELKKQAESNADAQLKIAILEFNSGFKWITENGPEDADDFYWRSLTAGGTTDVGMALKELNSKLDKDEYLRSSTGAYLPIIIFMTDGTPTDDYMKELEVIRKNKWYHKATKIGFAIGECDVETIAQLVGNVEAVISTNELETFSKLIKIVSTTASMVVSSSAPASDDANGGDIVKDIIKENEDELIGLNSLENIEEIKIELPSDDDFDDDDDDDDDDGDW